MSQISYLKLAAIDVDSFTALQHAAEHVYMAFKFSDPTKSAQAANVLNDLNAARAAEDLGALDRLKERLNEIVHGDDNPKNAPVFSSVKTAADQLQQYQQAAQDLFLEVSKTQPKVAPQVKSLLDEINFAIQRGNVASAPVIRQKLVNLEMQLHKPMHSEHKPGFHLANSMLLRGLANDRVMVSTKIDFLIEGSDVNQAPVVIKNTLSNALQDKYISVINYEALNSTAY